MARLIAPLCAVLGVLAVCLASTVCGAEKAASPALLIHVRVVEEPVAAAGQARPAKVLAEPTLVAAPGRPFCFAVGGKIPTPGGAELVQYGTRLEGTAAAPQAGQVRVDLCVSTTAIVEHSADALHLQTQSHRVIRNVALGKRTRLPAAGDASSPATWIELLIEPAPR